MSVQIFRDVEEALSREVRRIAFDDKRTQTRTVLQDVFDPFTGELVKTPIEPSFYDSSADANNIQYPQFFIKLVKSREDRFTKRDLPVYGNQVITPVPNVPAAFQIIVRGEDGVVLTPGNQIQTSLFNIRKIVPGNLIRLLSGNNKGTYIVSSITIGTPSTINLSNTLAIGLPSLIFSPTTRIIVFNSSVDLTTVAAGDQFIDSLNNIYPIHSVDLKLGFIRIGGTSSPNLDEGGSFTRVGNVLLNEDLTIRRFLVLDPSKPIIVNTIQGIGQLSSSYEAANYSIPIDTYYLIRIDSKERATHIDILNRVWEEFNPPRTGLPIISRNHNSTDQLLTKDIYLGGSNIVNVKDASQFNIGDPVFIIDAFTPTRDIHGNIQHPFQSEITDRNVTNNTVTLTNVVPDCFKIKNDSKIVSNSDFFIWMFHFVDHNTKDVEGAQYWVHEFTFWIQVWIDRTGKPIDYTSVTNILTPLGDLNQNGNIILNDT